jgi:hypothetical protein
MKQRLYILGEFLHFIFVATPVFLMVITAVYVGFFFYDIYNLTKKLWQKFSKH